MKLLYSNIKIEMIKFLNRIMALMEVEGKRREKHDNA
jgi:hypothetical protein